MNVKILVCITCIYIIFIYQLNDFTQHQTDHMNTVIKRKKNNNNSNKAVTNIVFIYQLKNDFTQHQKNHQIDHMNTVL